MAQRPILFRGPLVRATLDGRKTQTRRLVTARTSDAANGDFGSLMLDGAWVDNGAPENFFCPFERCQYLHAPHVNGETSHRVYPRVTPGDLLYVRETWRALDVDSGTATIHYPATDHTRRAVIRDTKTRTAAEWSEYLEGDTRGRPSIFMPRWASRLTLRVTEVRVERLQDISEEDAEAEGVEPLEHVGADQVIAGDAEQRTHGSHPHVGAFAALWDEVAGRGPKWTNSRWVWVWVVAFERVEP